MPLPWIPRIYLSPQFFKKLELTVLASDLGIAREAAAIKVVSFWWIAHIHNNDITPADETTIDADFGKGFAAAMLKTGWICLLPPGHVSVPRYDKYLSKRATRRIERNIRNAKSDFVRVGSQSAIPSTVANIFNTMRPDGITAIEAAEPRTPKKKSRKPPPNPTLFERFYQAYPRKKARGDAEKAFNAAGVDDALLEAMLTAIDEQKKSPQWSKDNGQYIPYPATWIRAKRWLDEGDRSLRSGGRVREKTGKYDGIGEVIGERPTDPVEVPKGSGRSLFDEVAEESGTDRDIPY